MKKDDIIMASIFGVVGIVFAIIAFTVESTVSKWVWGILAILVIGFTIIASIDAIIKNKRRPKDLADILAKAMVESMSKPDFAQRMEADANKRNQLFEGQRTDDPDYGYSSSNPIMTSTIFQSDEYLNKLRTLDGKAFTWDRTGSLCMKDLHGVKNVMIDEYQLFINGQQYKTIYICPYGHSSSYVPQGMKLAD